QIITKKLRGNVSRKINRLPIWYYNKTSYGDVLSRVTNDVDSIGQTLNQSVGILVSSSTLFAGSLVMMLITSPVMTIAAVVSTALGFAAMAFIMARSQKYFIAQQKNLGEINGHVEEIYAGHSVVKAYNAEEKSKKEFDRINDELRNSAFKSQFFSGLMMPLMVFIGNFGYVAVSVTGAVLAINGSVKFGVIVAFMIYIRLFTQPLSQLAQVATSMQSTAAASERVFEFLDEEEMEDESHKTAVLEKVRGEVEFRHVRFGYEDSDEIIIHDFSAVAKPGQKVAIVGPTGAGKTTIVNLLMRFNEIKSGMIIIDGVPTSLLSRERVHDLFCMVLQDTWLFEGTIYENVAYCKEGVSEEEVKNACKAVGIHHFIKTLPNGYDTLLGDESSLSAGQKQQLTIARAIVQNAPMLILDEATSSVDTRTEVLIQNAMDRLMEGRTSFVIAHRLSTIKNADIILVMKNGDIVESGRHAELLEKNGEYAELYNSQFETA
ncbi:MAG: ABC transporter ATP-binding protein, partial [Eubacteriales bacterium]